jgi:hypothetical protein
VTRAATLLATPPRARHNRGMRRSSIVLALSVWLSAAAALAAGPTEFGLELMPSARKIGAHRYQSDRNYEATVKFFREKFRGAKSIRWMREVSVPGVKYVHIENENPQSGWDGLNISLVPDGSVQLYVLERKKPTATSGASTAGTATSTPPTSTPPTAGTATSSPSTPAATTPRP